MISLGVHLYGKPAWDMKIEGEQDIDPDILKVQGEYLQEHLYKVADIVRKLKDAGWKCQGTLYSLVFSKEKIRTTDAAEKELKKLGIDLEYVCIEDLGEGCEE